MATEPTFDEYGIGDDYRALLARQAPTPPPEISNLSRFAAHTLAMPFNALSGSIEGLTSLAGAPMKAAPDPEYMMAPATTGMGKALDLYGTLGPVALEMAATGGLVRGALGAARVAANPVATRMLTDALGLGIVGGETSQSTGYEQAAEGLGYGALSKLARSKRLIPAALIAAGSKAFFDWEGGQPIAEGSPFTVGDINSAAGFLSAIAPGVPKAPAPPAAPYKYTPSNLPLSEGPLPFNRRPQAPYALGYTPPSERSGFQPPGTSTIDVPFEPTNLLPLGRADNRFAPITDFMSPQTEAQILNRTPARKDVIAMPGAMAEPPTPGAITPFHQLPPEAQMWSPELASVAKAASDPLGAQGYTPTVRSGLNEVLDRVMREREDRLKVSNFMEATNPEADINPQKAKISNLPEYRRSEGGMISQEAAEQLAKAGGRGLVGALAGGAAAHFDDNPDTDPRLAAALGFAGFAFGPQIARHLLERAQGIKRMASVRPLAEAGNVFPRGRSELAHQIAGHLGIEFQGTQLDRLWTFRDPVTGSNLDVPIGTDLEATQRKLMGMRKNFERPAMTQEDVDALVASQKKISEPSIVASGQAQQLELLPKPEGEAESVWHVTTNDRLSSIRKKGLLPMQTSNWVQAGSKQRYGRGEVHTFENFDDAAKWAASVDWERNKTFGSGKVSILEVDKTAGKGDWEQDFSDPLRQSSAKGKWLKKMAAIPAKSIKREIPFTEEMAQGLSKRDFNFEPPPKDVEGALQSLQSPKPQIQRLSEPSNIVESGIVDEKMAEFAKSIQERLHEEWVESVPSKYNKGDILTSASSGRKYEFVSDLPDNKVTGEKMVLLRNPFNGEEASVRLEQFLKGERPAEALRKLKESKEGGFVMPELSQAMSRALLGGIAGSFTGGFFDDPDSRQGMVIGGMVGAGAFMFGPAVARSTIKAIASIKAPHPPVGKPSLAKDWISMITNLSKTIEEASGAMISRGSTLPSHRFVRFLSKQLELNLPPAVKAAMLQSKGMASLFLDHVDAAIMKVALRFSPDQVVKDIANKYLDGNITSQAFLQELQPHIAMNAQVGNYAKMILAGRETINGLQSMLVSGINDVKLKKQIEDSIGKYITKSYRIFTDPNWNPDENSIQFLMREIHQRKIFGENVSMQSIETHLRQYIREVKAHKGIYSLTGDAFPEGLKINQQVLMERKNMSDAWKKFLGEITDPTERIYQTVFRIKPLAEANRYFESILKIDIDELPQAFRNMSEKEAFRNKLLQQLQNTNLSSTEKDSITRRITKLDAYQSVDAHEKFGAIQGHVVSLPVWDTLQTFDSATHLFSAPWLRSLTNAHTAIKLGRTAFNPMTVLRNMVTMPTFMMIGRVGLKDIGEAWDLVRDPSHKLRAEVLQQGIMNVDQVSTEFYKEFQRVTGSKYNFGHIDLANMGMGRFDLDMAEKFAQRGVRNILDFYRLPDNVVRIGAYIGSKRRIAEALGKAMDDPEVIRKATEFTNRYTMNYDSVVPLIKNLRQVPFTNLFISYAAEMTRITKNLMQDVAFGNGGDLAKHDRLWAAIPVVGLAVLPEMWQSAGEASLSPKDRADWEQAKRLMPDYARTRYRVGITRDPKTKMFHYTDVTSLIPSDALNQMGRALAAGDIGALKAVNPVVGWDNTPAMNIASEMMTGKDRRTQREFRGKADYVAAIAKEVLPSWMPGGDEWNRARQAHAMTGEGDRGLTNLKTGVRVDPGEFWGTYFGPLAGQAMVPGTKKGSVSLNVLQQRIVQKAKNDVANETAYFNDVWNSTARPEVKERAAIRFRDAVANLREEFRVRMQGESK